MNTTQNRLVVNLPSDTQIAMTRTFNAPRELVFDACTKCEHMSRWWGPREMTMASCELDFRVGGAYRFVLRKADGSEYPFKGEYEEIRRPDLIRWTFIFDVEPFNTCVCHETMVLTEENGRTTIHVTMQYDTKEQRDGVLASGMESGAGESYDRLEELLPSLG